MPSPATWCWWLKGTGCAFATPAYVVYGERDISSAVQSTPATSNNVARMLARASVLELRWKTWAIRNLSYGSRRSDAPTAPHLLHFMHTPPSLRQAVASTWWLFIFLVQWAYWRTNELWPTSQELVIITGARFSPSRTRVLVFLTSNFPAHLRKVVRQELRCPAIGCTTTRIRIPQIANTRPPRHSAGSRTTMQSILTDE